MELTKEGLGSAIKLAAAAKVLTDRGIQWDHGDMNRIVQAVIELEILPNPVGLDQLTVSNSAELVCSGLMTYSINICPDSFGGTDDPLEAARAVIRTANMFVALSELARENNQSDLTIEAGQAIALCDPLTDGGHPIYALFDDK